MRFLIHGAIQPEAPAALAKREHACHALAELTDHDAAPEALADPALLLALLAKKQWNLLTTDTALVRGLYENKRRFAGVIVLILPDPAADQGQAIARLFARYPRLTSGRLYTVTPSRVKIRQLPGAGR